MPLKVLIIGAGICGPAMATLLRRSDPENSVTIVERYPGIRKNGQQIDLRSWGVPIMQRLRLMEAARKVCVKEDGLGFVDTKGKLLAVFGVNQSGTGQQGLSSEYEIMRGDLAQVLYDASLKDPETDVKANDEREDQESQAAKGDEDGPGVRYKFNTSVKGLSQDEKGVDVTFTDGCTRRFDLVLGADGQWSKTRRQMFGEDVGNDMFKRLNVYIAYYTVPVEPGDDLIARFFQAGGGRCIMRRTGDRPFTQVYLMIRTPSEEVRQGIERQPVEKQKETFEKVFQGAGWQTERFLKGLRECTDFYADSLGQVKGKTIVKGRIALLGDAAYCASPITGMGTTVSLIGAYILAGELARQQGDVPAALQAYDTNIRSYINEAHKFVPGVPGIMTLESGWAITIFNVLVWFIAWAKLDWLLTTITPENKGGLKIPEFPELGLGPAAEEIPGI